MGSRALNRAVGIADADLRDAHYSERQRLIAGEARISRLVLDASPDGRVERGIWQITEGVMSDVEYDEASVVISGRAMIEFEDGATIEIGPGDFLVLEAGARTVWTIHETVRKAYQVTYEPSEVG